MRGSELPANQRSESDQPPEIEVLCFRVLHGLMGYYSDIIVPLKISPTLLPEVPGNISTESFAAE